MIYNIWCCSMTHQKRRETPGAMGLMQARLQPCRGKVQVQHDSHLMAGPGLLITTRSPRETEEHVAEPFVLLFILPLLSLLYKTLQFLLDVSYKGPYHAIPTPCHAQKSHRHNDTNPAGADFSPNGSAQLSVCACSPSFFSTSISHPPRSTPIRSVESVLLAELESVGKASLASPLSPQRYAATKGLHSRLYTPPLKLAVASLPMAFLIRLLPPGCSFMNSPTS